MVICLKTDRKSRANSKSGDEYGRRWLLFVFRRSSFLSEVTACCSFASGDQTSSRRVFASCTFRLFSLKESVVSLLVRYSSSVRRVITTSWKQHFSWREQTKYKWPHYQLHPLLPVHSFFTFFPFPPNFLKFSLLFLLFLIRDLHHLVSSTQQWRLNQKGSKKNKTSAEKFPWLEKQVRATHLIIFPVSHQRRQTTWKWRYNQHRFWGEVVTWDRVCSFTFQSVFLLKSRDWGGINFLRFLDKRVFLRRPLLCDFTWKNIIHLSCLLGILEEFSLLSQNNNRRTTSQHLFRQLDCPVD